MTDIEYEDKRRQAVDKIRDAILNKEWEFHFTLGLYGYYHQKGTDIKISNYDGQISPSFCNSSETKELKKLFYKTQEEKRLERFLSQPSDEELLLEKMCSLSASTVGDVIIQYLNRPACSGYIRQQIYDKIKP